MMNLDETGTAVVDILLPHLPRKNPYQVRLLFPAERWSELDPALQTEQSTFPEVKIEVQEPQARLGMGEDGRIGYLNIS